MKFAGCVVRLCCGFLWVTNLPAADDCVDCHPRETASYRQSAMAQATFSSAYQLEQQQQGDPSRCLVCHGPTASSGVTCSDCHEAPHQHRSAAAYGESVCGRCHDAPLENTLRHYRVYRVNHPETLCQDCHLPNIRVGDHRFMGVGSELLRGRAVRGSGLIDRAAGKLRLVIDNLSGHGIPGGTSGRSLWLVAYTAAGPVPLHRWGWLQDRQGAWLDHGLPPGETRWQLHWPEAAADGHLGLWLQTRAGDFSYRPGAGVVIPLQD